MIVRGRFFSFFFFNDTATTEIYTLSLHDALPISRARSGQHGHGVLATSAPSPASVMPAGTVCGDRTHRSARAAIKQDRKSTRLNSSHGYISYAVFCLKKKKRHTVSDVAQTCHSAY